MTKRMSSLVSVSAIAMAVAMAQPAYSQVKLQFGSNSSNDYVVKQGSNADVRDAREDGRDDIRDAREDGGEAIRDARSDPTLNKRQKARAVDEAKRETREDVRDAKQDTREDVREANRGDTYIRRQDDPGLTIQVN